MAVETGDAANAAVAPAARVRPQASRGKKIRLGTVLVIIVAAIGFLLWKGLGDATSFYRNADEAVHDKSSLGAKRFRLQGSVVTDSVKSVTEGLDFTVAFNGVHVPVHFVGTPAELFKPGIAVVLEGHWNGDTYDADNMLVKHSETYKQQNPGRVDPNGP